MKKNVSHTYKGTESTNQERLRQQAIKDKEKERTQFYQKQREEAKVERTKIREKVWKEKIQKKSFF